MDIISSVTGNKVRGYRAPKWSLTPDNQVKALSVMAEEGIEYDSSFFARPGADRLRVDAAPVILDLPSNLQILEIPVAGLTLGPWPVPVAGGFYFRLFPQAMLSAMLRQRSHRCLPGVVYLHPFDLDSTCPILPGSRLLLRLFRTYGTRGAWMKFDQLLRHQRFSSIEKWIGKSRLEYKRVVLRH
jgi:hypothetical protein